MGALKLGLPISFAPGKFAALKAILSGGDVYDRDNITAAADRRAMFRWELLRGGWLLG
jgi:hypothetical protein